MIPTSLKCLQLRINVVHLSWEPNKRTKDIRYLIEERHLLGPRYSLTKYSSWMLRNVTVEPQIVLRGGFKMGHFYQFRVAAVNGYGCRGYSEPSRAIKISGECIFFFYKMIFL